MGIVKSAVQKLFPAWFESKASEVASIFAKYYRLGEPIWSGNNYESYSKDGYQKNPIVFRCINLIAKGGATVPWEAWTKPKAEGGKIIPNHRALALLRKPNPMQGGHDLINNFIAYLMLRGDSYMEGVSGNDPKNKAPSELYVHRPDRFAILPGKMGIPGAYHYKLGDYTKDFPVNPITGASQILHWKTFNPLDDWNGLSPISAAAMAGDSHNGTTAWNKSLIDNGGAPSGIFTYSPEGRAGDTMPVNSRRQLEQDIEERINGAVNAGRPWIVDGGIAWQQLGLSPKDADWLAGKKVSAQEICAVFGVATQLLGIEGSQTFANYAEARMSLYEDVILPLMDCIADMLNVWLMPMYGDGAVLVPNVENLPALQPKREKQWAAVQAATWLTPNEKREATGEEPYTGKNPDGSEITNPADMLYAPTGQSAMGSTLPEPVDPNADPNNPDDPAASPDDLAKSLMRAGVRKSKIKEMVALAYGEEKPEPSLNGNGRH